MIKTVSLETAKALKDAGFRQDNMAYYYPGELSCFKGPVSMEWGIESGLNSHFKYAAPTTDELLEELPEIVKDQRLNISKERNLYFVSYEYEDNLLQCFHRKSLPEALAQMWLHLKKESLI